MDEKELENKNEQKETLDGVDVGEESVVTKHEIAMALFNFCHNIYSYCCLPHASGAKLNKKANRFISEACFLVYWFWQQSLGLSCFA